MKKLLLKRAAAIALAVSMLLGLVSCGEEPAIDYKTELTDQTLTYSLEELNALK